MRLITWEMAQGHLKRSIAATSPPSSDEVDIRAKVEQAEALVIDFVNQRRIDGDLWGATVESWDATNANAMPPPQVQAAVLVQLKELDRFRGDDLHGDEPKREVGMVLHPRAAGYLHRHRDPAIA